MPRKPKFNDKIHCATCHQWSDKPGTQGTDGKVHHQHCPLAPIGQPSFKGVGESMVGDPRDVMDPTAFGGTYDGASTVAGHKKPDPPGTNRKAEGNVD